jgi:hypothetical protein
MSANDKFKEKYYVEINPDTEIVRVSRKEDLHLLNEVKPDSLKPELSDSLIPELRHNEIPSLMEVGDNEVCGHWDRKTIVISEIDYELYKIIGSDVIVGGYCPDCDATFSKKVWVR